MEKNSKTTKDHERIKDWAEARNGFPALVDGTEDNNNNSGLIRIAFREVGEDSNLKPISWDKFFEIFDGNDLTFLFQERTDDGHRSRFCKFIDKENS